MVASISKEDAEDDGTNECFTVTPVTPALPTTAGPDVLLGNPVTDNVILRGTSNQPGTPAINPTTAGAAAGGTITFTLLKDDCTTLATGSGTNPQSVPVNGNGTYGPVSGASPQTVATTNTTVCTTAANVSWRMSYDSTNRAQRDIPATCLESTVLTINNGVPISSP